MVRLEPRAVFTHCYGHSLNLACSDAVKGSKLMRNALDIVREITKLVKLPPRQNAIFQQLKEGLSEKSPGIRILCLTRWTVRAQALKSILDNYQVLLRLWDESLDIVKEHDMRGCILGVSTCMMTYDFFFGVVLGELLLRHSDNLSKSLQTTQMSAAKGQEVATMTIQALLSL